MKAEYTEEYNFIDISQVITEHYIDLRRLYAPVYSHIIQIICFIEVLTVNTFMCKDFITVINQGLITVG